MNKIVSATVAAMVMTVGASAEESFFDYKQEIGIGQLYLKVLLVHLRQVME